MFNINSSNNDKEKLHHHEQRVAGYVENALPSHALDNGTNVMVKQVSCSNPGCVPLETLIVIVFPNDRIQYIEGLSESKGGSFRTKILLPVSKVTKDHVLNELPPCFDGGRKTWTNTCLAMRDMLFSRIGETIGNGSSDVEIEQRGIMSQYLISALQDYLSNGCVAPVIGAPFTSTFPEKMSTMNGENNSEYEKIGSVNTTKINNYLYDVNLSDEQSHQNKIHPHESWSTDTVNDSKTIENSKELNNDNIQNQEYKKSFSRKTSSSASMMRSLNLPTSNTMIQKLSERDHFPCIRSQASCPCCDSESLHGTSNFL